MTTKKISELTLLDTVNANLNLTVIPVLDTSSGTTRKVTLQQLNDSIEANIPFAAAAFTQANTPSHVANSASSYANASFIKANTALSDAASASLYANAAFSVANNGITDSWSRDSANSSSNYANSSFAKANASNILAQSAYDYANNIVLVDSWARNSSNSSGAYANAAFAAANNAVSTNKMVSIITTNTHGFNELTEDILLCDPNSAGSQINITLPDSMENGKVFTVKNINSGGNVVYVQVATGTTPLETETGSVGTYNYATLANTGTAITWVFDGTTYRIIYEMIK